MRCTSPHPYMHREPLGTVPCVFVRKYKGCSIQDQAKKMTFAIRECVRQALAAPQEYRRVPTAMVTGQMLRLWGWSMQIQEDRRDPSHTSPDTGRMSQGLQGVVGSRVTCESRRVGLPNRSSLLQSGARARSLILRLRLIMSLSIIIMIGLFIKLKICRCGHVPPVCG